MIEMKQVYAGYYDGEVLHDINLTFQPGEVTILIGPNGCGKSTLLKTLIRLNEHTSGEILVDGTSITEIEPTELAQKIAYLAQNRRGSDITVERMVLHGRFPYLKYPRRYRKEDFEKVKEALQWMGIEDLAGKNVSQLSGGTQQKVYIAMALAQDTQTILMDEPTVYLDIAHQIKTMEIARKLADQGKAVIMVLHDLPQAFQTADKIVVMSEGKVKGYGTTEEIYKSDVVKNVFGVGLDRVQTNAGWQYYVSIEV